MTDSTKDTVKDTIKDTFKDTFKDIIKNQGISPFPLKGPLHRAYMSMPQTFSKEDVRIAERFGLELATSIKGRIASVAIDRTPLSAEKLTKTRGLIPLIVFLDDLSNPLTDQDIRSYLQVTATLVNHISKKLHITTLKLSEHWERFKLRMPQHLDLLRYGTAVYDKGFFEPIRFLVTKGRIQPSLESQGVYITRAESTMKNANHHLLQASLDLYWAGIDACHAGLMKHGQIPSEPVDIARRMQEVLVARKILEPEYPRIMQSLFELSRGILHKNIQQIPGPDYDHYYSQTVKLVKRMERMISHDSFT